MLSKSLSTSEKFARLNEIAGPLAEFCQALYPLIIAHTDDFGRLQGDPFTIKHQCFPASPRPLEEFGCGLSFLHDVELIIWYHVKEKRYIQIPRFDDHQVGLHKRTRSAIPRHQNSRKFPEVPGQLKGREENLREEKGTEDQAPKAPAPTVEFLEWFQAEYKTQRDGAIYVVAWDKHGGIVKRLLKAHALARLKQHAHILLTTDEEWVETTDRGIEVLAGKINWLEERLCVWERKQGRKVAHG